MNIRKQFVRTTGIFVALSALTAVSAQAGTFQIQAPSGTETAPSYVYQSSPAVGSNVTMDTNPDHTAMILTDTQGISLLSSASSRCRTVTAESISCTISSGGIVIADPSAPTSISISLSTQADEANLLGSPYNKTSIAGGGGDDSIVGPARAKTTSINGGNGSDTIVLNGAAGTLRSGEIHGGEGNDTLIGSDTTDALYGDSGKDTLTGNAGSDLLVGGSEVDVIFANDSEADQITCASIDEDVISSDPVDVRTGCDPVVEPPVTTTTTTTTTTPEEVPPVSSKGAQQPAQVTQSFTTYSTTAAPSSPGTSTVTTVVTTAKPAIKKTVKKIKRCKPKKLSNGTKKKAKHAATQSKSAQKKATAKNCKVAKKHSKKKTSKKK